MKNFVVAYGQDCDGANFGHITRYTDEEQAKMASIGSNESSDGIMHTCVDLAEAIRYYEDHETLSLLKSMTLKNYHVLNKLSGTGISSLVRAKLLFADLESIPMKNTGAKYPTNKLKT